MGTTPPSSYGTPHYATGEPPEYTADHERPLVDPPIDPLDRTRFPADEWRLVETAYSGADLGVHAPVLTPGSRLRSYSRSSRWNGLTMRRV